MTLFWLRKTKGHVIQVAKLTEIAGPHLVGFMTYERGRGFMSINVGDQGTAMDFAEQFDRKIETGTLDAVVVEAEHAGRLAIAKVVSPELVEFPNKSQNEAATCLPGIAWLELFPETPMALQG